MIPIPFFKSLFLDPQLGSRVVWNNLFWLYSLERVLGETFKDCIQPTQFINNFLMPAVYLIFSFTYWFQETNAFMCFLFLSEPQSLFVILFLNIMQNTVNRSIICGVL